MDTNRLHATALALLITAAASAAEPAGQALFGHWARQSAECAAPELSFAPATATIRLDADGKPVAFDYPSVRYRAEGSHVTALLGAHHPFARTPSKTELVFAASPDGSLQLQRSGSARPIRFLRCP